MIKKTKNKAFFSIKRFSNAPKYRGIGKIGIKSGVRPHHLHLLLPLPPLKGGARVCNQSNSRQYKLRNKELNITTVPWRGWGREGVANTSPVMFARWHSLLHTFRKYWTNVCIAYAPTRINKCLMKIVSSGRFVDEQTWRIGAIIRPCSLYRKRNDVMGLI